MLWILVTPLLMYTFLIGCFVLAYGRQDLQKNILLGKINQPTPQDVISFSLIIPFRNEAHNLPKIIDQIKCLDYPKDALEILFVNDASEDESLTVVRHFIMTNNGFCVRCIDNVRQTASPKKDAITTAIDLATYDWIVTTDADCAFVPNWLESLSQCILEKKSKMVVGPVRIEETPSPTFLNVFEQLDFLSLMGATIAGFGLKRPFLCNGANLAYEKKAFLEVSGFTQNDHIASGDDHFLLEKFTQNFTKDVHYIGIQEAIVTTQPQKNWQAFFSQRTRWAAKGTGYTHWFSKMVGIAVLSGNIATVLLIVSLIWLFIQSIYGSETLLFFAQASLYPILIISIALKSIVDYWLISKTASFLDRKNYLRWFPVVAVCHPFVSSVIAIKALIGGFTWKGRRYKR